ncbi:RNA 3'-terminal phosphate cyclase, partial [Pseudomonas aeruginosa]|uniref:RNA 3'-terminal phosphate cyclase n=1 Tax=Pseudomonas aeruginosa TaxID=287 RepID=UPI00104D111D
PALLAANGESRVRISGGTHNPLAPPADFLRDSWLPLLQRMGAEVDLELLRHGFVPAGGGELLARVRPARWRPLQLPALLAANGESRVRISGGTHNPLAPPADFLRDSWLPLLQRMGAEVDLELLRHGFVPAGGGELLARVRPARWRPLQLEHPGAALRRQARALLAGIPGHVGERELERVRQRLGWSDEERQLEFLAEDQGPGNALLLRIDCEHICATFCAFGQAGVSAERVAEQVATQAIGWMESGCAADEHLADQLLLPMALAGAGSFTTPRLSAHLQSNRRVIERFLPVRIGDQALDGGGHRIVITSA